MNKQFTETEYDFLLAHIEKFDTLREQPVYNLPYQSGVELELLHTYFIKLRQQFEEQPFAVLEIGSLEGHTLCLWSTEANHIVSVDKIVPDTDPRYTLQSLIHRVLPTIFYDYKVSLHIIDAFSQSDEAKSFVKAHIDNIPGKFFHFIYIDGGHTYEEVRLDFENYFKYLHPFGIIAFHDIDNPLYPGVKQFWAEQKNRRQDYIFIELYDSDRKMGTGFMLPKI